VIRKLNNFYPYALVIIISLAVFFMGGCSATGEKNPEKESLEPTVLLPPLQRILPDDPYLFLPLETVGFQLTFTQEVDPAIIEQLISFKPELDFTVQSSKHNSKEIYLQPQEKLQSDTIYTLQVKGVKNESTGKPETLKFTYRTEFQGDRQIANPQWSHDGEEIIYLVRPQDCDTAELWKVRVKDGNEQLLASGLSWPGRASWSPDDSSILYTKMVAQSDKRYPAPELRSVDREGREEKVVVSATDLAGMVNFGPYNVYSWWSPGGEKIALQLDLGGVDAHSDLIRSMAVVDSDGSSLHPVEGQIFVGWQNEDSLMVLKTYQDYNHSRAYRYDLFLVDADGNEPARLLLGKGQIPNFDRASQSPDHNTLVIGQWKSLSTVNGFKNEGTGLFLYNVPQGSLTPFGLDSGYQKHPAVSPLGKVIAFASNKDGNWNLYLRENGRTKQLTSDPAHELYPVWSPKGDKFVFVSTRSGTEEIWILNLSTGNVEQLTGLDS